MVIEFKRFMYSNKKIDTLRDYVTFFIRDWRSVLVKILDAWKEDLKQGFNECMRVLKPCGTLIFKWNEEQVKLSEVLKCFNQKPLFGNKRSKTHWLVFVKNEVNKDE